MIQAQLQISPAAQTLPAAGFPGGGAFHTAAARLFAGRTRTRAAVPAGKPGCRAGAHQGRDDSPSSESVPTLESLTGNAFQLMRDAETFAQYASGRTLREYQRNVVEAVMTAVLERRGHSLVVMFPRQSGKNELQAHLEAYLLCLFSGTGAEIVKVSPTLRPQAENAMRRLEGVLRENPLTRTLWHREAGHIYRIGKARITFLSAAPESNIVGATASLLLEVDEAQHVAISKYDKEVAPMAASTNATRVFWGTAWTSQTLLGRELRSVRRARHDDGIKRLFKIGCEEVAREVPEYGKYVAGQVALLGRRHPMVRTQYYSEEIDADCGMFPARRIALMKTNGERHPATVHPQPGRLYAFLLDVAGQDEKVGDNSAPTDGSLANPRRDATALTIVEIDLSSLADELIRRPTYRPRDRRLWVGTRHTRLYAELKALAALWKPRTIVVDATGIGAGLSAFLSRAFPGQVIPFTFTSASKSRLGWDFLSIVDTGRWKEGTHPEPPGHQPMGSTFCPPADDSAAHQAARELFFKQLANCQYEIQPGAEQTMRWGVPDGASDPDSGEPLHDDLVISAALSAVLDRQDWSPALPAVIIPGRDPLDEMEKGF